jgi:ABC-type nitrate/sulfonate/bicarbonate transport system substrate-binding protein
MRTRLWTLSLLALVTATGTWALLRAPTEASRVAANQTERIKVQLQWVHQAQFAGLYVAVQKGYFRDENLEVELVEGGPGVSPIDVVLNGKADIGLMTADQLMLRSAAGSNLRVVGTVFDRSTAGLAVRDVSIGPKNLSALAGKTAYVYDDFDTGIILRILEKREGFQTKHKFPGALSPLQTFRDSSADIFGVYVFNEPVLMKSRGVKYRLILPEDVQIAYYADAFFATASTVLQRRSVIQRFMRAAARGWAFASAEPDEAVESMYRQVTSLARSDAELERNKLRELVAPAGDATHSFLGDPRSGSFFGMRSEQWRAMCAELQEIALLKASNCAEVETELVDYSFTPVKPLGTMR